MPLAGTPAPIKTKKSTKLIGKLTREVMPQEGSKLNLGKKISIPRDVMLEELSLLTNKGSKMFKLRQLRVEKFIYENHPDIFTDSSVVGEKSGGVKKVSVFKTYISPWERAMGISPQEKSQFTIDLLLYGPKAELPHYKSFNRTAMPYGGYEKARKLMTFQMPEFDVGPLVPEPIIVYNQEINTRPSFNRTPIPWQASGEPTEYNIEIKVPMDGETEEL
ncbi:cyclic AMP-responsive element-binding protein 3-like protein 2 [Platysternon megacephalum]|uniref:Cyclic AMP-responsive element-binding protein 3-like protein 2 n=1 Tax=Platysternon megacephalum TaxID=55544 RepID=A0A4D9E5Y9_9SAUR|nr:cyclic AMP-responsive element-binding protein 3-like protein 2 [Platysternon megacephalum]